MKLILASQSPRRRELLARMGLDFTVISPRIDEDSFTDPDPTALVRTLSREKSLAVAEGQDPETLVIAADTVVVLDGQALGKPGDEAEAAAMLSALSGRSHEVYTGVTVCQGSRAVSEAECTRVTFRPLTGEEIRLTRDSKLPVFIAFTPEVGKEGADSKGPLSAEGKAETDREEILDIEAIMEEIRAEARKNTPYDLPEFEQTVSGPEACSGQLMQDVMRLTDNYVIPPVYVDQSLNPLKRLYRKWTRRAMGCVTVPLTARVTETNQHFRTALEETTKVIEQQQRQIEELTKRIRELEG